MGGSVTGKGLVGLVVCLAICANALAQPDDEARKRREGVGERGPRPIGEMETKPFLELYDKNNNGVVTPEEYGGPAGMFKALDKDGNGKIDHADLKALQEKLETRRALDNPIPFTTAFDKNGDGLLDADEWPAFADAVKQLDKNGDGKLSPDELRGEPKPREGIMERLPPGIQERLKRGREGDEPGPPPEPRR